MQELEKKIGYVFKDKSILETALTHSSYANEHKGMSKVSNERMEFLGDSVLGMTVADHLYSDYPDMTEGGMTRLRAELVCENSLRRVSVEIGLGKHIKLGKGEEHSGGRDRSSILADAVEALIAALYLDGGFGVSRAFIVKYILSEISTIERRRNSDYKTALQELVQQQSGQVLSYNVLGESGPDHNKRFETEVCLNGKPIGIGVGRTKKVAEQAAAKRALEELER